MFLESTVLARVNKDLKHLRPKVRVYYERVPSEKIQEFHGLRQADVDRSQKLVNKRFPELPAAREAFLGPEKNLPGKNQQV